MKQRIQKFPKVNYTLMIKVQDWIMKYRNIIASPITNDILRVIDEVIGTIFYLFIFVILLYY